MALLLGKALSMHLTVPLAGTAHCKLSRKDLAEMTLQSWACGHNDTGAAVRGEGGTEQRPS